MATEDYYQLLGISRQANEGEIKKAYRRMAMQYHPDRNVGDQGAEEKFKSIQKAYEVLSDPQKREIYDRYGDSGFSGGASGGFSGAEDFSSFSDTLNNLFGDIFGGAGGAGGAGGNRHSQNSGSGCGADVVFSLTLTLDEVMSGAEKPMSYHCRIPCEICKGSAVEPGKKPITCTRCGGHGVLTMRQGFFTVQQTCPSCQGVGKMIKDPCRHCHGRGSTEKQRQIVVKIPFGIHHGDTIRLSGQGEASHVPGESPGDLYVKIKVQDHPIFKRDSDHLFCETPISFIKAAIGGSIKVPTLNGSAELIIPSETQTGQVFRLSGKGLRARNGRYGDLHCQVNVEIPVKLTDEQKKLLEAFDLLMNENAERHSPRYTSWFDKVKKFFNGP